MNAREAQDLRGRGVGARTPAKRAPASNGAGKTGVPGAPASRLLRDLTRDTAPRLRVLAIDPGPEHSAVCLYDTGSAGPIRATWTTNAHALEMARFGVLCDGETICERADVLAIEKVISYGQLVGAPTFETVYWSGRFAEAWGGPVVRISQPQAKSHLCYTPNAKDAQWRAALLARFGGKGTKKAPGRLYGFNEHRWSALLIAVAVADLWWERGADGGPVLPVEGEENGD